MTRGSDSEGHEGHKDLGTHAGVSPPPRSHLPGFQGRAGAVTVMGVASILTGKRAPGNAGPSQRLSEPLSSLGTGPPLCHPPGVVPRVGVSPVHGQEAEGRVGTRALMSKAKGSLGSGGKGPRTRLWAWEPTNWQQKAARKMHASPQVQGTRPPSQG